jgi:hypothetical protein
MLRLRGRFLYAKKLICVCERKKDRANIDASPSKCKTFAEYLIGSLNLIGVSNLELT